MSEPPGRPYVGLENYKEGDAPLFFGRDSERQVLLSNLRTSRFTLLYAQSGAGKSSLLQAGVMARLRELANRADDTGLPRFIPLIVSSWAGDPIDTLKAAVTEAVRAVDPNAHVEGGETLEESIEIAARSTDATFLIIFDQFEEYFRHQRPEASVSFVNAIGSCVSRPDLPVNFLVSIREDRYASVGNLFKGRVPNVYGNYLRLLPLDAEGAEQAIRKPLELFGVTPEDALVDAVLKGIRQKAGATRNAVAGSDPPSGDGQYVAAPYLQLVMEAVWNERSNQGSHVLGLETLTNLGGTDTIIQSHVSAALDLPEDQKRIAAATLRYLAPSDRGKLTLTVARLAEFTGYSEAELEPVLERLDEKRILAAGGVANSYELLHDVLASHIIRWRSDYDARELDQATEREQQEREAKLKAQRRVRGLIAIVFVGLVCAGVIIAAILLAAAKRQRETAQSEQLAATSQQISDLGLKSLYALEAYRISHTINARSAILQIADSHEIGMPFADSSGGVSRVAWSPDGKTLAAADGDGTVGFWDVKNHQEIAHIPPPGTGDALRHVPHLDIIGPNIGAVAFSPDGRRLAYGENIEYYDAPNGIFHVLATVRLWDVQRRKPLPPLPGHSDLINALAFSRDGSQLASASSDKTVRLWHLTGHRRMMLLPGHTGPVNSVAFSRDGRTLASSSCDQGDHDNHADTNDYAVLLSSTRTGKVTGRLPGLFPVCSVAFSPKGKTLAASSDDQKTTLWDVAHHRPIEPPFVGHTDVLNAVAFSPDGATLASAGRDHTVRLWDVVQHRELGAPLTHAGDVNSVAFSPDGHTLASPGGDGVRVWTVAGPHELEVLRTHRANALSVAFSRNGRTVAWTDSYSNRKPNASQPFEGTVYLWDTRTHHLTAIPAPIDSVNAIAFSPDSRTVVWAGGNTSVLRWDVPDRRFLPPIVVPRKNTVIRRVAYSRDGHTIAFDDTNAQRTTIRLWDTRYKTLGSILVGNTGELGALAFSPNSQILASAGTDGTVRLWNVKRKQKLGPPFIGHRGGVFGVAFSPDGKTLASGGADQTVRFWDVAAHRERGAPLTQHTAQVYTVAFSPDGKILASASLDGTVRLWDVGAERSLLTLTGHTGYVFGLAFNPDGQQLASASNDGTVRLWGGYSQDASINRLCTYIDKRTAPQLWHQDEPSIPYRQPC